MRSVLGPMPDSWDVIPLKECLMYQSAGDWGDDYGEVERRIVRSTNFTSTRRLDICEVPVRGFTATQAARFDMKSSDILVERSGGGPTQPVGRVVVLEDDLPGHGFSNFVHLLRIDPAV